MIYTPDRQLSKRAKRHYLINWKKAQSFTLKGDDLQSWLNLPNNFIDRFLDELLMGNFQE